MTTDATPTGGFREEHADALRFQRTIAHLSDLHLDGTVRAAERVEQVISHIEQRRTSIDLIVLTGDITESTAMHPMDVIARTFTHLDSIAPTLICMGNSDRPRFDSGGHSRYRMAAQVGSLLALGLDSTVPGEIHGWIDADDIGWLRDQLRTTADVESVILAMHHPPVRLGHPIVDRWRSAGSVEALEEFVASSPVVATLVGHTHAATWTTFGGKPLVVAPGVHSAGRHRADIAAGVSQLIDESAPPSYLLHTLGKSSLVSQHVFVGGT